MSPARLWWIGWASDPICPSCGSSLSGAAHYSPDGALVRCLSRSEAGGRMRVCAQPSLIIKNTSMAVVVALARSEFSALFLSDGTREETLVRLGIVGGRAEP